MASQMIVHKEEIDFNELELYESDTLTISRRKFVSKISGAPIAESTPNVKEEPLCKPIFKIEQWYPYCNSYYSYTEGVDAFARVNHLLASKPPKTQFTSEEFEETEEKRKFQYSTRDAQIDYLETKPLSFLILGKPSIGEEELGRQLADYWHCVYIDPETLIKEEIESGSRAGQCIEFNLRCGRAIGIDVILRLVDKRIKTESVAHRGFVVCGLPVIPNDLYEEDPVSAESAVFTVQEIFEDILDAICDNKAPFTQTLLVSTPSRIHSVDDSQPFRTSRVEWGDPHWTLSYDKSYVEPSVNTSGKDDEKVSVPIADNMIPPDFGDSKQSICEPPEIGTNYEEQLNFIMNLFRGPFLIIYMVCDNQDVINKRADYRYDIYSGSQIDLQKEKAERNLILFLNKKNHLNLGVGNMTEEIFENIPLLFKESSEMTHLVRLPRNFPANVQVQLEHFVQVATKLIDAKVLDHNPEYYLRVDGRTSIPRIFDSVKWKLRTLNTHKVLIPEKLLVVEAHDFVEGEGDDYFVQKQTKFENLYECFKEFSRKKIVNPMFKWEWSDWGTHCPVAMTRGIYVEGEPKYAVQFMNNIFFLSSQEAFVKFHRNPRPFLLPPNPRSHGKLYVIGPNCSGKTAVSQCLGYLLDCVVLSPVVLYKKFVNQRKENLMERMRQAMINDKLTHINADRMRHHQLEKLILEEKVKIWLSKFRQYIEGEFLRARRSKSDTHLLKLSSFPVLMGIKVTREEIEKEVQFDGIFLTEATAKDLWEQPDRMRMYLPEELRRQVPDFVPVTALDESVLKEIEDYVITSDVDEIVLGEEDLLEMYGVAIKCEEDEYMHKENCRGGWIIDGVTFDFDFFQRVYDECTPDHVIILEDSSGGEFLLDRYRTRGLNLFTEFERFFQSIGKPEVAARINIDQDNMKGRIVEDILGDILTQKQFLIEPEDPEDIPDSTLLARRESQINYKTELDEYHAAELQILDFLQIMNKDCIVIDVNNKTLENLLEETVAEFENKYRLSAVTFTDTDRLIEARDFGQNLGNEGIGESTDQKAIEEFETNRRYGDTFHFCPVTFGENWVLWKPKQDHIAKFQGKIYLCSNEKDLNSFIHNPRKYISLNRPPFLFPPPRICVVGNCGSGKTSVSKALAENFALCYFSFMDFLSKNGADDEKSERYQDIRNYLTLDAPLPKELLLKSLQALWFEEPYKSMGFVIDDFPKRPSDINEMLNYKAIPDVIIYLKVPRKELKERTFHKQLAEWHLEMDRVRAQQQKEHYQALLKWEQTRRERFDQMMETRRQQRYASKKQDKENKQTKPTRPYLEDLDETDEDTDRTFRSKSQVTFDSVAEQEDMDEVSRMLGEEMPEPIFEGITGNIEDIRDQIRNDFEDTYDKETEILVTIKELCLGCPIPWEEVKSEKQLELTQYEAYILVDKFRFRNESFFERTYEISLDVAERLLNCGYFLLSQFGRTCPVQYNKGEVAMQLFLPMEQKFNVFPIIHRQYIYFVIGKDEKREFQKNPLKYVDIDPFKFPLIPVRLAIIGPPKCGKSALADRFRNELGLKVITKGQAARYVMNYLTYSTLAVSMEERLRDGLDLKEKMVLSCVEASMFDPRAVTQGVVMDGFPSSAKEVKYLASMGLTPHLVIDLYTEDPWVYQYVSTDALKQFEPPYSKHFMEYRYKVWEKEQQKFRSWLDREYQNMVRVPINTCMWDIWEESYSFVKAAVYEIKHYHIHSKDGWPLRLSYMLVSPLEFKERQSSYKMYCPCCLCRFNKLVSGGSPPDRTGLVHFHDLKSIEGTLEYACQFGNATYLFNSMDCLNKFMQSPWTYCNVNVTPKVVKLPSLSYKDLPPLGTLEQFVAKDVISALKSTTTIRPVLPGLSIEQSALLCVALFLKINNKRLTSSDIESYVNALDIMHERRKSLLQFLEIFKKHRNPFVYYEEPVPPLRITKWIKEKFGDQIAAWSYTDIMEDKAFRVQAKEQEDEEE
ncbi:hypothetical protein HHI36_007437 [Cryptolaemus montrouzieri]|uniref:Adenylate kinase 9 n=1 Tax=Cryptolaemus montrouzieri TaxID=559131 RepID=A0ABD2MPN8_9CUCU